MTRIEVSAVAFQEGDQWVAQCVEYDIAAHAHDLPSLPSALERAVMRNVCVNAELGRDGLVGIPAAPDRFRTLFEGKEALEVKPPAPLKKAQVKIRGLKVVDAQAA